MKSLEEYFTRMMTQERQEEEILFWQEMPRPEMNGCKKDAKTGDEWMQDLDLA